MLLLFLVLAGLSQSCPTYTELIKKHEGLKLAVYPDSKQHPTICYGFNLDAAGAKKKLEAMYPGKYAILTDTNVANRSLTKSQCDMLLAKEMAIAVKDTKSVFGMDYCPCVFNVLVDFVYNLGMSGAMKFKNLKKQLIAKNYTAAAAEMKDSLWCTQVKTRCTEDVALMAQGC